MRLRAAPAAASGPGRTRARGLRARGRSAPRGPDRRRPAELPRAVVRRHRHAARRHPARRLPLERRRAHLAHDAAATSGARSRRASRRPRRSSRAGGCCSAATSPTTTSTRPSARRSTAAACSRSPGCPAASSTRSCAARTGTSTSRSTRRARGIRGRPWRCRARRARSRSPAPRAAPTSLYAATGRAGLWRSVDAGVSWARLPVRANAQSVATTPGALAARRRGAARAVLVGRLRRDVAPERPARHDRRLGSAQRAHLVRHRPRRRAARLDRRRPQLVSRGRRPGTT